MNKYVSVFKKIHIHPLLWIIIGLAIITANFFPLILLLIIIFVHEMGHVSAALYFSWRIKRIVLLPFGGVAEMEEHSNKPFLEELIVILFGPLQHLFLIIAAWLLSLLSLISEQTLTLFLNYNLMILFFNLLPIWPLDGGKLLLLFLSMKKNYVRAYELSLLISAFFLCLFGLITLLVAPFQLNIWVILSFIALSLLKGWQERRYVFIRFLLARYYGKELEVKKLYRLETVPTERITTILKRFKRGAKHIIVIKNRNESYSIDENELLHACFADKQLLKTIGELKFNF